MSLCVHYITKNQVNVPNSVMLRSNRVSCVFAIGGCFAPLICYSLVTIFLENSIAFEIRRFVWLDAGKHKQLFMWKIPIKR